MGNQNKKINSWAISWYVSIFENNGYCLNPPVNLVLNKGFDKIATHTKTSSLLLVANKNHLSSTFSTGLPYAEPITGNDFHGGELGIQGSRSAESLKLWIGLRQLGEEGIEKILLESIKRRCYLESMIDSSKFEVVTGPLHLLALTPVSYTHLTLPTKRIV